MAYVPRSAALISFYPKAYERRTTGDATLCQMPFSLGHLHIPIPVPLPATLFSSHQTSTPVLAAGQTYLGAPAGTQPTTVKAEPPGLGSRCGHGLRAPRGF